MAKKDKLDDLIFCDQCGGSIPKGTTPFVVEGPDGTKRSLCQECTWAAKADEEQPTLALEDDLTVDESALASIHRPDDPESESIAVAEPEAKSQPEAQRAVAATPTWQRCKTFTSLANPHALDFLDDHINDFIKTNRIRVKHASTTYGMAGIGPQGTRVDAIFVTLWW